ncbi:hypothetical protein [Candidatus Nitrososphaera sp. FF02]|uniref:hypothetical protein n=1 Tax=Candidatus Nitrososphaera sp. FF02 TaxID=3398226 RepID=UPI0039E8E60A
MASLNWIVSISFPARLDWLPIYSTCAFMPECRGRLSVPLTFSIRTYAFPSAVKIMFVMEGPKIDAPIAITKSAIPVAIVPTMRVSRALKELTVVF